MSAWQEVEVLHLTAAGVRALMQAAAERAPMRAVVETLGLVGVASCLKGTVGDLQRL